MKLKSGLAFIIAAIAFGAQARDMNSIQQSGELKVGVPGDYAPLAFHNKAGELLGYDVDMAKDLGKRLGLKCASCRPVGQRSPPICRPISLISPWAG